MTRLIIALLTMQLFAGAVHAAAPFAIQVVDDQTGRGVPLVELTTTNDIRYVTDSNGIAAFDEPGLMNQKVFFTISSFGYEFAADGFGEHGIALQTVPGKSAKLKIKRINIAERIYRVTGEGIYRDSILAGRAAPIREPLLNTKVMGQDSVQSVVYRDKAYFFFGDTSWPAYPLGNFRTTGAIAELPGHGGLDPSVGVNLKYFAAPDGFTKHMVPIEGKGPVWIDALMTIKDDHGQERMLASFARMENLGTCLERGLIVFDDAKQQFARLKPIALDALIAPAGHPFQATVDGTRYIYFPQPYPCVRVKADWASVTNLDDYEALTCLKARARYDKTHPQLDVDSAGRVNFSWKRNTPALHPLQIEELISSGTLRREDCPMRLANVDDGKPILLHGSSVYFNDYRKKFVMIGLQSMGDSMLGEVWYAESASPDGPWTTAKKIATHHREKAGTIGKSSDNMDFYNPQHHVFFDQDGGKIIYFEGTYTHSFSGNPVQTPRYEYNQLMYRLDLSDPRLAAVEK